MSESHRTNLSVSKTFPPGGGKTPENASSTDLAKRQGKRLSRREFLERVSGAGALTVAGGFLRATTLRGGEVNALAALGGKRVRQTPFPAWPPVTPEIEQSWLTAFRSRRWGRAMRGPMQGDGLVVEFERRFAQMVGAQYCLATGSCTQALHTALQAIGVAGGDEVLVAPCTFIASVQAILLCGALPVFVDVDLETFQMDPEKMAPLIGPQTRAVEPVHIAGLPCQMDRIMAVANQHGLKVVEDAAQAHLAEFQGKKCGTFGAVGCFSFQWSKMLACGEGGALVSDDKDLIDKCYLFHNLGLGLDGSGVGIGTKYRMHELEAALLLPQLQTFPAQTETRNQNARYLDRRLAEIPGIVPQKLYPGVTRGGYYLYGFRYLKDPFNGAPRSAFVKALRAEGIPLTTMYFDRLNTQPFIENALNSPTFQKLFSAQRLKQYREQNHCPVNDRLSEEGIWLPQHVLLGAERDMDDIVDAITKIYENREQLKKLTGE